MIMSEQTQKVAKGIQVGESVILTNGNENKQYEVTERDDNCPSPPEYRFRDIETDEVHGPVQWQWMDREDIAIIPF
jgi:hypothetical protein